MRLQGGEIVEDAGEIGVRKPEPDRIGSLMGEGLQIGGGQLHKPFGFYEIRRQMQLP